MAAQPPIWPRARPLGYFKWVGDTSQHKSMNEPKQGSEFQ
ncbi:hypothetical protein UVI_02009100 [Ustilaginoidea virens]|uniref:Uncharacterized protein n=1 Tax=Ustilaginoidea virens TaxID=1159556 RepID=A0A1B5KUI9_USTVR|nr:hypothetical protein UVI_02009100 [Ustilaginoidea virens]